MNSSISAARRSVEEQVRLETMLREIFEHSSPFNEVLGIRVESFDLGSPQLAFDMRQELTGSIHHTRRLHGGVIASALDTIGGFAVAVAIAEKNAEETSEQI